MAGGFFTSWATQGKPKNTRVGSLSFLQQIFLTQELNGGLLHCRWIISAVYVIYWHWVSLGKYFQDDGLREAGYHGHNAAERMLHVMLWSQGVRGPCSLCLWSCAESSGKILMTRGAALNWVGILLIGKGFLFLISVPPPQLLCT